MNQIAWGDFEKIDFRIGTIVQIEDFPEAHKPAYKVLIDLGNLGTKKSSAQIVGNYTKDDLMGMQVLCVCNFPEKQIGPFISEVLITGFPDLDAHVVLATTDKKVPNGAKLF